MTFEELKFLIIDRQRRKEIDKLFHLYIKAESYSDILKVIKSSGNFRWILNNGFRDLVPYFPVEELENENIFQRSVELTDISSDIIILSGGYLHLTQTGKNRCKVIVDGSRISVEIKDMAMVEVESFNQSLVTVYNYGYGYAYLTSRNNSAVNLIGKDNSTFNINAWGDSNIQGELEPKSYIYYKLNDDSKINISKIEKS